MPVLDAAKLWDPPRVFNNPNLDRSPPRDGDEGERSRHPSHPESIEFAEKSVGWIELFFDLSAAFCISTLSESWTSELAIDTDLPFDIPWHPFNRMMTLFSGALLVKLWSLEMYYKSIFQGDNDIFGRFLTILQMLNIGALYQHVSELYNSFDSNLYCMLTAYFWQHIFLGIKIIRAMYYNKGARFVCASSLFHIGLDLLIIGMTVMGGPFDDNRIRFVFLCVCPWYYYLILGIVRYATKLLNASFNEQITPNPPYVTERFGLLMLLVFGEMLLEANEFASSSFATERTSFLNQDEIVSWWVGLNIFAIFWLYIDNIQPHELCFGFFRRQLVSILHTLFICSTIAMAGILKQCFEDWNSTSSHSIGGEETYLVILVTTITMFLLFTIHAAIHSRRLNFVMMFLTLCFGGFLALLKPRFTVILTYQVAFSYVLIFLDVYYRGESSKNTKELLTRLLTNLGICEEREQALGQRVVYERLLEDGASFEQSNDVKLEGSQAQTSVVVHISDGDIGPRGWRSASDPAKAGCDKISLRDCVPSLPLTPMEFKEPITNQQ